VAGGSACPAARTRRCTSTTGPARRRSARCATRESRRASPRSARKPAWAACATSACSCTTPTPCCPPPPPQTRRSFTRPSCRCSSTRMTPRSRPRRRSRASRPTGSTPPAARRSTRSPSATRSRCRCILSTAPCLWSGTSRRCPRSPTWSRRLVTTRPTRTGCSRPSIPSAFLPSTWPACSLRARWSPSSGCSASSPRCGPSCGRISSASPPTRAWPRLPGLPPQTWKTCSGCWPSPSTRSVTSSRLPTTRTQGS
jgi:hypothetical protein